MMGLFGLILFILFGAIVYSESKKDKRRRLQNLREGKWVRKAFEKWVSEPETVISNLISRKPDRERTLREREIQLST